MRVESADVLSAGWSGAVLAVPGSGVVLDAAHDPPVELTPTSVSHAL